MMGLDKPQLHAKLEVAGFMYYGNMRKSVLNDKFAFKPPFGELGVTLGLYL